MKFLRFIVYMFLGVMSCYGMKKESMSVEELVRTIKTKPDKAIFLPEHKPEMYQVFKYLVDNYMSDISGTKNVANFLIVSERVKLKKEKPDDSTAGECPVCMEPGSFDQDRQIVVLPCGHYCCETCVKNIRNVKNQYGEDLVPPQKKCPFCKKEFFGAAFEFKVNVKNFEGLATKSFFNACTNGDLQAVKNLSSCVVLLNDPGLRDAARHGKKEIVEYLLAQGADPNQCDAEGRTALVYANAGADFGMDQQNQADIIDMMITKSKVPVSKGAINDVLASAARNYRGKIITILFQKGAEIAGAFQKLARRFAAQDESEQQSLCCSANFLLNERNFLNKAAKQDPECCCVCLEEYGSDHAKQVSVLPCGHYLCVECFNKLNPRMCPTCRTPCPQYAFVFEFKPDIRALQASPMLMRLIQRAQKKIAEAVYKDQMRQDVGQIIEEEVKMQFAPFVFQLPSSPRQSETKFQEKGSEEREQKPPAQHEWACPRCTLLNDADVYTCPCGVQRPIALQPGEWQCQNCTLINQPGSNICDACGVRRP